MRGLLDTYYKEETTSGHYDALKVERIESLEKALSEKNQLVADLMKEVSAAGARPTELEGARKAIESLQAENKALLAENEKLVQELGKTEARIVRQESEIDETHASPCLLRHWPCQTGMQSPP